jgi:hypothetical protein
MVLGGRPAMISATFTNHDWIGSDDAWHGVMPIMRRLQVTVAIFGVDDDPGRQTRVGLDRPPVLNAPR